MLRHDVFCIGIRNERNWNLKFCSFLRLHGLSCVNNVQIIVTCSTRKLRTFIFRGARNFFDLMLRRCHLVLTAVAQF